MQTRVATLLTKRMLGEAIALSRASFDVVGRQARKDGRVILGEDGYWERRGRLRRGQSRMSGGSRYCWSWSHGWKLQPIATTWKRPDSP